MPTVEDLFEDALRNEPTAHDLVGPAIVTARTRQRRARVAGGVAAAAVVAACGATAFTLVRSTPAGTSHQHRTDALTINQLQRSVNGAVQPRLADAKRSVPTATPSGPDARISAASLAGLVERGAGITLSRAQVQKLPGDLDLSAAVHSVGGVPAAEQYLNLQVVTAGSMSTTPFTCTQLSDLSSGYGDGYAGTCRIHRMSGGGYFVQRSGTTATGGYTKSAAYLVRADGSAVSVEVTNQRFETKRVLTTPNAKSTVALPPVVSTQPPVSASRLASLVRYLDQHR